MLFDPFLCFRPLIKAVEINKVFYVRAIFIVILNYLKLKVSEKRFAISSVQITKRAGAKDFYDNS